MKRTGARSCREEHRDIFPLWLLLPAGSSGEGTAAGTSGRRKGGFPVTSAAAGSNAWHGRCSPCPLHTLGAGESPRGTSHPGAGSIARLPVPGRGSPRSIRFSFSSSAGRPTLGAAPGHRGGPGALPCHRPGTWLRAPRPGRSAGPRGSRPPAPRGAASGTRRWPP